MMQAPRRTRFSGPQLSRLLARLADVDAPESGESLSGRLSQWLGWTDAIALSAALNPQPPGSLSGNCPDSTRRPRESGNPATSLAPAKTPGPRFRGGDGYLQTDPEVSPRAQPDGSAEERACAHVRASLTAAIAGDRSTESRRPGPGRAPLPPAPTAVDFAACRPQYLFLQQTMEREIAGLRNRLRTALAARAPHMNGLAQVDAVMERVLGAREQTLFAGVPALLEAHFRRLQQAGEAAPADASPATRMAPWLRVFRGDMQAVLLAELDLRFQPIDALLAALRGN